MSGLQRLPFLSYYRKTNLVNYPPPPPSSPDFLKQIYIITFSMLLQVEIVLIQ